MEKLSEISSELFVKGNELEWESAGEGVRRKILGYDDKLMMILVEFKKGAVGYLHTHPHRQVTYLVSGSFDVTINNEKKILKQGECYFVPPMLEHGVTALEDSLLVDVFTPVREDILKINKS